MTFIPRRWILFHFINRLKWFYNTWWWTKLKTVDGISRTKRSISPSKCLNQSIEVHIQSKESCMKSNLLKDSSIKTNQENVVIVKATQEEVLKTILQLDIILQILKELKFNRQSKLKPSKQLDWQMKSLPQHRLIGNR
jgi:hypothetical protein